MPTASTGNAPTRSAIRAGQPSGGLISSSATVTVTPTSTIWTTVPMPG